MRDVSVVGLGLMGTALARAFMASGARVCVWNRSPGKGQALADQGAQAVASLAEAVGAAPMIVVCVDSYATTQALFGAPDVAAVLRRRQIIQLSTGTPEDARAAEVWFGALGAGYLDGAILCGPNAIGTADAVLLFAGRKALFDRAEPLLRALSPGARWVGEGAGAAAALDLAWLSQLYGTFVAAAHGALICESEDVDLDLYLGVLSPTGAAASVVKVIKDAAFDNPTATLSVWNSALRRIGEQARSAGIPSEVPDFVGGILDRAEAAGFGNEHVAAMLKVMRRPARK